jgi:hypothetical protein
MTERYHVVMTQAERTELAKVVRLRAKVAKDEVCHQEALLLADVEAQLSAKYSVSDEAWADLTGQAAAVVAAADAEIAKRCLAMGIREEFRPRLVAQWYGRGENALKERRAELRKAAQTKIAAMGKAAKIKIDHRVAHLLTQLAAGALESAEARAFLESMPSIDEMMPRITLPTLGGSSRTEAA